MSALSIDVHASIYSINSSSLASLSPSGAATESTMARKSPTRTVFVVDDETLIADSVTEILIRSGYAARAFYDGRDALECARRECPDVVISDVMMPQLNGVQLAIMIRALCPAARIVLFSGQASTVDMLKQAEQGGHAFELLAKPIHPRELLKALAS